MKVLITGVGGQLGTKIYAASEHENYGTYFGDVPKPDENLFQLNLLEREKVLSLIKQIKPEWVIHCAGATDVDWCEREKKAAWDVNVEATRNVVDACRQISAGITYISTSFVFDGSKEIYYENDTPNPINNYGMTKLEGEKIVQTSDLPFTITRTDQLYGWVGKGKKQNFVVKLLDVLRRGENMEVFEDWYNNPTLIDNLVEAVLKLLKGNELGIYHATGSTFINRYEWSLIIAEKFRLNKNLVTPVKSEKYKPPAKRPSAHMNNSKVQDATGVKMLTVEEGLEFMKEHERDAL